MSERGFIKQLSEELPRWQAAGWISEEGGRAILADLTARQARPVWASALALIGALLLGLGVITWFAAHWNEMGKLLKVCLIVVALTASHIAHGVCLSRVALPKLAQGMSLLSVLFFGAAIMLIGQIYHIDAHFPDGVALWAAGGLLTAMLLSSQPALVAALALAGLWTWYEQIDYRSSNWPLLMFLAIAAVPLLRNDWKLAARGWGVLLLVWLAGWHAHPFFEGVARDQTMHVRLFIVQVLGIAGIWACLQSVGHGFARAVRSDFMLAALVGAFVFTFPEFALRPVATPHSVMPWLGVFVVLLPVYGVGMARLLRDSPLTGVQRWSVIVLLVCFAALLLMELLVPRGNGLPALLWNGLFVGMLYRIGDFGMRQGDRQIVNLAFAGFACWVLARYFDTFWSLLDRSLFFMIGGMLLLAGGGWLERRRRGLVRDLDGGRAS